MPRKARKPAINYKRSSRRRNSAPNVYIPDEEADEQTPGAEHVAPDAIESAEASTPTSNGTSSAEMRRLRRRQARAARRGRAVGAAARTTVYTRDLPSELRKIGIMVALLAIALTVLTFYLR